MAKQTQTSALEDDEGNLKTTQEEIETITVEFRKNIMRKRTTDTDKLQTILSNISKKMNIESQMQLGLELINQGT